MKIVDPKPFIFPFECRGCKSKLEAGAEDVRMSSDSDGTDYYVVCPLCDTTKLIETKDLTPRAIQMARRRAQQ